jgi:hypothetical protein
MKAMWKCDGCGRRFANRNQSHFCGRYTLRGHLRGRTPEALAIYRGLVKLAKRCGRFVILPEKTRIAFQVRMSFAAVSFRRDTFDRLSAGAGATKAWFRMAILERSGREILHAAEVAVFRMAILIGAAARS